MAEKLRSDINIKNISGQEKSKTSILLFLQDKYFPKLIPLIPSFIQTNHLTLLSLFFSLLIILGGILFRYNRYSVILCIIAILGQYLTDYLDGEIGRRRKTGLIIWGFFMDHFLDFIFTCCNIVALWYIFNHTAWIFLFSIIISAGLFLIELHKCNILGEYNVHGYDGIGGIETRLIAALYFTSFTFLPLNISFLLLLIIGSFNMITLIKEVYRFQKKCWQIDMENKNNK